jgi:hypothetical protein
MSVDIGELHRAVKIFANIWFPADGAHPALWFRGRQPKYSAVIRDLCANVLEAVQAVMTQFGREEARLLYIMIRDGWPIADVYIAAVMFDQMPRNALAIGFGRFAGADPHKVAELVDDTFSLAFSKIVMERYPLTNTSDMRVSCFLSLIFRHSNEFGISREILKVLLPCPDSDVSSLPSLAQKFWAETMKRENLSHAIIPD